MKKDVVVLVAGTFDIIHESHINMLRNAKSIGDKLIVMLSTDGFNTQQGIETYKHSQTRQQVF